MDYEKVREQFGNWDVWMKDLIESEILNNLYRFLKSEKQKGREIIPASKDVWASMKYTDRNKVKCIVLLQSPYATQREVNKVKVTISNGIPLDCESIKPYQMPALYQWYQAIETQYGFHPDNDNSNSMKYLLEQGVWMFNTAGTSEINKDGSHQQQWHEVTKWIIENIVNKYLNGVPIIIIGTAAKKFEQYLNPLANPIKYVEHPSVAAQGNRDWKHEDCHKWANSIIEANNGPSEKIQWMRKKQVEPPKKSNIEPWIQDRVKPVPDNLDLPW